MSAEYHRPTSLEQCFRLLQDISARTGVDPATSAVTIVAGATDVYPARATSQAWGQVQDTAWLDITALQDLRGIEQTADGWRIGALVTWADILAARLPPAFDGLKAAAAEVGGKQIQSRGTVVGNICNASPAADGVPPLLCLACQVELASENGTRLLPLQDYILGNRKTDRRPNELVTALLIPAVQPATVSGFHKLGARRYLVISIVMASALIEISKDREITAIAISVGACSAVAARLDSLEKCCTGKTLDMSLLNEVTDDHFLNLQPLSDVRATRSYRVVAARQVVNNLLDDIIRSAGDST